MKTLLVAVFCAGLLTMQAATATASPFSFDVIVNTNLLIGDPGAPFYLDFQLNDGSGTGNGNNTVILSGFNFGVGGSAGPAGSINVFGGASGSLASSVTLTDTGLFNEFFQQFTPGSSLRFNVSGSSNVEAGPTPDAFVFGILDSTLANIPTTGIGNALLLLNLSKPSITPGDFQSFTSTSPAGVTASPVPEPASLLFLVTGLAIFGALRWRRDGIKRPVLNTTLAAAFVFGMAHAATAQVQGPSTGSTPYVLPLLTGTETISVLTVDNTGGSLDDIVGAYRMAGIPDGMGAFDNGNGTFTVLLNQEMPSGLGVARAHGGAGAFVSEWVIDKFTLAVFSGQDLIKNVYGWNATTQSSNTTKSTNVVFFRFCSADLPAPTAFFNSASGLGSTERIYLNGEEDTTHGWALAHIATGVSKGNTYVLGRFNPSTNGSGLTGIGAWETLVASPYEQDKTIVIGNNDGGTGLQNNALAVYVGTKRNTGTEADKAGLTNGTLKFVAVTGNPVEIVSSSTRATNITNGTRFTLSAASTTVFSRPEDGAWNPLNPREYYFVTTDQLDQASDGLGAQVGQTRLWRLTFDDITNPDLGGKIDLLLNGRTVNGQKINMLDNISANHQTGRLLLQEDVGGAPHNGKMWEYDPATDSLTMITRHDPARFGNRAGGVTTAATAPFNNDEESSGVIDITEIMSGSTLNKGNLNEAWYISADQAHYTSGITSAQVEGGQMFVIHQLGAQVTRGGLVRDRRTGTFAQQITVTNGTGSPLAGPIYIWLDGLSANASLVNGSGTTGNYIVVPGTGTGLAAGASASVILQFANPTSGPITYTTRVSSVTP